MKQYKKVKTLLASPNRWTKGSFAVDSDGLSVASDSPRAVAFCLSGALNHVYGDTTIRDVKRKKLLKVIAKLYPQHKSNSPIHFNDQIANHTIIKKVLKEADV